MTAQPSTVLVVGSTGSIGTKVVAEAVSAGHHTRALVRQPRRARGLDSAVEVGIGDLTRLDTLVDAVNGIDAIVFTHGSNDGEGVNYGAVRNVLQALDGRLVRIALMTSIGVTERNDFTDWKRRGEHLVRASGNAYTIVRPGWFDYNEPDQNRITMRQGTTPWTGTPADGSVSRRQIARVLIDSLTKTPPPSDGPSNFSRHVAKNRRTSLLLRQSRARPARLARRISRPDQHARRPGAVRTSTLSFLGAPPVAGKREKWRRTPGIDRDRCRRISLRADYRAHPLSHRRPGHDLGAQRSCSQPRRRTAYLRRTRRAGHRMGPDRARPDRANLPTGGFHSWHAIFSALTAAALSDPGVTLIHNARVAARRPGQCNRVGDLRRGRTFGADFVIGADGHRSVARAAVAPEHGDAIFAGYLVWLASINDKGPSGHHPR